MTRKKRTSGQTKNRLPKREKPLLTHFSSLLRAFASQVIVATGTTTTFQSFFWIQRSEDVKTSSLGTVLKSRHLNFLASKIIHLNLRHTKKKKMASFSINAVASRRTRLVIHISPRGTPTFLCSVTEVPSCGVCENQCWAGHVKMVRGLAQNRSRCCWWWQHPAKP